MGHLQIWLLAGLATMGMMTLLWLLSLLLRNSSIVDIFWGAGFILAAWMYYVLTPDGFAGRKLLVCLLVTIWGLRLSLYILWRNWGKPEDYRYAAWRRESGPRWWWVSLFKVFLLQGALLWFISAPLLAAQISPAPANFIWLDGLATLVWGLGFFFEAVGDWQLARFKADPANRGRLITSGLWRYTRHPNYFGDATQWWGYYLLALAAGGWWTIFSPFLMTFLLLRVSGVRMLEKNLQKTKPGYEDYMGCTSAFLPLPPRKRGPPRMDG
jgi:steroid 5-alpha reductase family enzyme